MHGASADSARSNDGGADAAQMQIDAIGFGLYQMAVLVAVGSAVLAETVELGSVEPLNAALAKNFGMAPGERAMLPAIHYLGSGIGIALAGPLCDGCGRKGTLVLSNVFCIIAQCLMGFLPLGAGPNTISLARGFAGFAVGLGLAPGTILMMESCPANWRTVLFYGLAVLSAVGYIICALGLLVFMPDLGESVTDSWRDYCFFTVTPAIISLPFLCFFVCETPAFHIVNRNPAKCARALAVIAEVNGTPLNQDLIVRITAVAPSHPVAEDSPPTLGSRFLGMFGSLWRVVAGNAHIVMLLMGVDGLRTALISGASYLVPQMLEFVHAKQESAVPAPSVANVLAETSPILGLVFALFLHSVDARTMSLVSCIVAASALGGLTTHAAMNSWRIFLLGIMVLKISFSPLSSCVTLLKAESFPAEGRATAFSCISLAAKFGTGGAPTVIELLRGTGWTEEGLSVALHSLMVSALCCGFLVLMVPHKQSEGISKGAESREVLGYGSTTSSSGCSRF